MKRTADEYIVGKEKLVKLSNVELYKAPTSDELQHLAVSVKRQSFAQSDILQLQISELLSEVSIKASRKKQIDDFVIRLSEKLKNLASSESFQLSDESLLKKFKVKVPLVAAPSCLSGNFRFRAPEDVQVIGSYAVGTCMKPHPHVDLAVTLPKGFVHSKDRWNQAYHHKRARYLSFIAEQLAEWTDEVSNLSFLRHRGNHMVPVLVVKAQGKSGNNFEVRIHTMFEEHHVKRNNLHVSKCNVKKAWFNGKGCNLDPIKEQEDSATPHYNTGILNDMNLEHDATLLSAILRNAPGLKDGIRLLKLWLRQRELDQGYGSMSGFIMSMFVVYLLREKKLNESMAAFQMFRDTLAQLANVNWHERGISLCSELANSKLPTLEDFHRHFPVVFIDETGYVNLCAAMSVHTLKRVKHEASLALKITETPGTSAFELLFMKPVSFLASCDQVLMLTNLSILSNAVEKLALIDRLIDHCGQPMYACEQKLLELIEKAIGKRVKLITHNFPLSLKWSATDAPPPIDDTSPWMIGFILDPDSCNTILEKGPSAETPEALAFREFWGEKSELRRFQDGSICEAVVWPCENLQQRRGVLLNIVKYCLERHAAIPKKYTRTVYNQLDFLLKQHEQITQVKSNDQRKESHQRYIKPKQILSSGTGEEDMAVYMEVFSQLCKVLRSLELPLTIQAIHGITPELRYTEVFPVKPATFSCVKNTTLIEKQRFPSSKSIVPTYVPLPTVICMLEGSGKWPDDCEAVRRMKAAFLIQLARQLNKTTNVTAQASAQHVHVMLSGYAFRLQLGYSYEITLLKRHKAEDGRVLFKDTEEATNLQRQLHSLPPLASTLTGLHHTFNSFSNAVRLAKRWVASQMLLNDHVPEEAVELMVAAQYLHPQPYSVPGSSLACFLRFLHFLSTFDWKTQPLLVNLNDEFKHEDYTEITKHFQDNRPQLPMMFIATPGDKLSSQWTKSKPSAPLLSRLALLAREAFTVLQSQLISADPVANYKQIFRPTLEVYDVVIHLKPKMVAKGFQAIDTSKQTILPDYSQLEKSQVNGIPVADFDPAQCYLRDIREAFGDIALFFYDQYGGQVIGMLWKPYACGNKPFSEEAVNYHMPDTTSSDIQLVPNAESVIEDLHILGEGLILEIETRTQNWTF